MSYRQSLGRWGEGIMADTLIGRGQVYLQSISEFEGDWRVDVITVEKIEAKKEPQIMHFENVIT
jgi:hypothetical protein